jgi:hypothetical protein
MDSTEPESASLEKHFASIESQLPPQAIMHAGFLADAARIYFDVAVFFDDAMCSLDLPAACLEIVGKYRTKVSITCYPVDDTFVSKN